MSEIVRHQPEALAIPDQVRYAEFVTTGDMIPQAYKNKPANAVIAIGLGQAMGLSPAESLYRIDVIQGKPTASAELIASNVRKAGHKLRVTVDEPNTSVTATIYRADDPDYPHSVVRDMAWAQKMGLTSKDNYKKQPLTMLQWRAISAVARLACSEALYGVQYTPDELSDMGERRAPQQPTPAASVADRLKAATVEVEPEPEAEPMSFLELADAAQGDLATLQNLYAEAERSGVDPDTLNYIRNSATPKETN
jgi:hypothetical protein